MRLPGTFRSGFAALLVGVVILTLVGSSWFFLAIWGNLALWLVTAMLALLLAVALMLTVDAPPARPPADRPSLPDVEDIKSRFLEIISHQLRTPLTAVRWNLEALLKGELGPLQKRQEDLLNITSKNYQGILVMLADWIEALEIERGIVQLNPEPVDLAELIESMSFDFKEQARLKRQKLTIHVPRGLPKVLADKLKLRYILSKLLNNALGYTSESGTISIRVKHDEKTVRVEVADTGVGIPYEDQPNVFKKFFRASNASLMQPNASGVGLFVARTLVQAQGGLIDFTSEEGKGTTFWFTLPIFGAAS
jgi:signal transduction histidine kinase